MAPDSAALGCEAVRCCGLTGVTLGLSRMCKDARMQALLGFPGEMEKFCTQEDMSDVENPHALIYPHA
jgi:hypothetical protein